MEDDADKRAKGIKCLQQFKDELHSQECREQVRGLNQGLCAYTQGHCDLQH
jgi:hypothetical protein